MSSSASASAGCHLGSFQDVMSMGAGSALDKAAAAAAAAAAAGFPSFAAAAAVASAAGASSAMSHYAVYAGNGQMHHSAHHHPHHAGLNHSAAAQMGGFHHHGSPSGPPPGSMAIHHSMGGISSSALGLGSTFNSMVRYQNRLPVTLSSWRLWWLYSSPIEHDDNELLDSSHSSPCRISRWHDVKNT